MSKVTDFGPSDYLQIASNVTVAECSHSYSSRREDGCADLTLHLDNGKAVTVCLCRTITEAVARTLRHLAHLHAQWDDGPESAAEEGRT